MEEDYDVILIVIIFKYVLRAIILDVTERWRESARESERRYQLPLVNTIKTTTKQKQKEEEEEENRNLWLWVVCCCILPTYSFHRPFTYAYNKVSRSPCQVFKTCFQRKRFTSKRAFKSHNRETWLYCRNSRVWFQNGPYRSGVSVRSRYRCDSRG